MSEASHPEAPDLETNAPRAEAERPEAEREAEAARTIRRFGYAAAGVTLVPIPLSETVGVVPLHVLMVTRLAALYGVTLERESALRLVARIGAAAGASYVGTRLAIGVAKALVPGLPGLLGAPLVFAGTLGLGSAACAHLRAGQQLSDEEIRAIYRASYQAARAEYDPRRAEEEAASSREA